MRIVLRADATPDAGTGHIMRCFALAEEFESRGGEVIWLSKIDIGWVSAEFRLRAWTPIEPDSDSLDQIRELVPDLVVLDSYALSPLYRRSLVDEGFRVLAVVDDSYEAPYDATLWVNPGVRLKWSNMPEERFLNGPDFVLLRSEIRRLRDRRLRNVGQAGSDPTIAVLLGGSDHSDFAELVAGLDRDIIKGRELVVGPSAERAGQSWITWLPGGRALLERAAFASVVLSASGVSSWEFLHIGTPLALMLTAGNQLGNYEWFTSRGMAYPCGSRSELINPTRLGQKLIQIQEYFAKPPNSQSVTIDGFGACRVVDYALRFM